MSWLGYTFECRKDGILMSHDARHRVGLKDLSWLASLPEAGLCTLICKSEGGFANQSEHNLGLIACERGSTLSNNF